MASSWGASWGTSWGTSWGATGGGPTPNPIPASVGQWTDSGRKKRRRERGLEASRRYFEQKELARKEARELAARRKAERERAVLRRSKYADATAEQLRQAWLARLMAPQPMTPIPMPAPVQRDDSLRARMALDEEDIEHLL